MSDGGKGSNPRPLSVDQDTFANNWDRIFRHKDKQIESETKDSEKLLIHNTNKKSLASLQEAAWLKNEYYDDE